MARVHVFADEAGNFDFSSKAGASRYFILTTVTMDNFRAGDALLSLRRQLAWEGVSSGTDDFHATEELQLVRDRVFAELSNWDVRVDSTILEKAKAAPHLAVDDIRFYKLAWYLHFKHIAPLITKAGDELLVMGASLGTKKKKEGFNAAIHDVVAEVTHGIDFRTVSCSGASDPCLWIADYCSWAIQRKWERGDERSYALIKSKVRSEFEVFQRGTNTYY
ncbi:MAG: DUF3800 domain-containing protein [Tepidiformaceae bacterium]